MIKKLCVIGAGTMGAGIAQVAVEKGVEVTIRDIEDRFVEKGLATIRNFLGKKLEKGKLAERSSTTPSWGGSRERRAWKRPRPERTW